MAALATYAGLKILHVHTNAAPSKKDYDWFSLSNADSMLICKKEYTGDTQIVDLKKYKCFPLDQKKYLGNMITYKELDRFTKFLIKMNERFKFK